MTDSTGEGSNNLVDQAALLHAFKNHISVIVGFCDLLLSEIPASDQKHSDILEIRKAGQAAMSILPKLETRIR